MRPNYLIPYDDPRFDHAAEKRYGEWLCNKVIPGICADLFPELTLDDEQEAHCADLLSQARYDDTHIPYSVTSFLEDLAIEQGVL